MERPISHFPPQARVVTEAREAKELVPSPTRHIDAVCEAIDDALSPVPTRMALANYEALLEREIQNGTLSNEEADELLVGFIANNFNGAISQQLPPGHIGAVPAHPTLLQ